MEKQYFLSKHTIADLRSKSKDELIDFIDAQAYFMMIQGTIEKIQRDNPKLYDQMRKNFVKAVNSMSNQKF